MRIRLVEFLVLPLFFGSSCTSQKTMISKTIAPEQAGSSGSISPSRHDSPTQNASPAVQFSGTPIPLPATVPSTEQLGLNGEVRVVRPQNDGKILLAGDFTPSHLIRLNPDSTIDVAFQKKLGNGFDGPIYAVTTQSDGKILVGGTFESFNGNRVIRIARLNSDGSIDDPFAQELGQGFDDCVNTIVVQKDGLILVGGKFSSVGGMRSLHLARLLSTGSPDTRYGTGIPVEATAVPIQAPTSVAGPSTAHTFNPTFQSPTPVPSSSPSPSPSVIAASPSPSPSVIAASPSLSPSHSPSPSLTPVPQKRKSEGNSDDNDQDSEKNSQKNHRKKANKHEKWDD